MAAAGHPWGTPPRPCAARRQPAAPPLQLGGRAAGSPVRQALAVEKLSPAQHGTAAGGGLMPDQRMGRRASQNGQHGAPAAAGAQGPAGYGSSWGGPPPPPGARQVRKQQLQQHAQVEIVAAAEGGSSAGYQHTFSQRDSRDLDTSEAAAVRPAARRRLQQQQW